MRWPHNDWSSNTSALLILLALGPGCTDLFGDAKEDPGDTGEAPTTEPDTDTDTDTEPDPDPDPDPEPITDSDGDGHDAPANGGDDCDDDDDTIHPGASEVWGDGIDQDCDGFVDVEGAACSADIDLTLPDGHVLDLDTCTLTAFRPTYTYADDAAPTLTTSFWELSFDPVDGIDCRLEVFHTAICGTGYYPAARTSTVEAILVCDGVGSGRRTRLDDGYMHLAHIDTGTGTGSHLLDEVPLATDGTFDVGDEDFQLVGAWAVTGTTQGGFEQPVPDCVVSDGDDDNDGQVSAFYGGLDCLDSDPTTFTGAAEHDDPTACMSDRDDDGWATRTPRAGVVAGTDCDDGDGSTHPGAASKELAGACTTDQDADGWADATPADGVTAGTDCNDADAALNHDDIDGDGASTCDADCDDTNPDAFVGAASAEPRLCTIDHDGDGFGDASAIAPLDAGTDCDDTDPTAYLGAASFEPRRCTVDHDGDGYGDAAALPPLDAGDDCDDTDSYAFPGAAFEEPLSCARDYDGDGFGDAMAVAPVVPGGDCDDTTTAVNPAATDTVGNGVDDNCDGIDGVDADGDGYASEASGGEDCNDAAPTAPGGVDDSTDGIDQDCDGMDGVDADGDGFTDASTGGDDCDDSDASTHPGASEEGERLLADSACDGAGSLSMAEQAVVGISEAPHVGQSVAIIGDIDGDGLLDVAVGAPAARSDAKSPTGAVYIFHGSTLLGSASLDTSDADYIIYGAATDDLAGSAVAAAGDVDGDGLDDLLVGAPGHASETGAAYLLLASSITGRSISTLADADVVLPGEAAGDLAGTALASLGDLDNDGLDDLLIGAPGSDDGGTDAGKAYVVLGSSLAAPTTLDLSGADYEFIGEEAGDAAGSAVSLAGDIDQDGIPDWIIGAPEATGGTSTSEASGAAYVVLGSSLGTTSSIDLSLADYELYATAGQARAGAAVGGPGDVDGDGIDDLLVGAPDVSASSSRTNTGMVYFVSGAGFGSRQSKWLGSALTVAGIDRDDRLGTSVAGVDDLDGDGLPELLVGAPGASNGAWDNGSIYILTSTTVASASGPLRDSDADVRLDGVTSQDAAGTALAAGDIDDDGQPDLLVGAPSIVTDSDQSGSVQVWMDDPTTASSWSLEDATIELSSDTTDLPSWGNAGWDVASAGDVDGDGLDDIIVGAPDTVLGGVDAGAAFIVLGSSIAGADELHSYDADIWLVGASPSDRLGLAVASVGDVDGDGLDDVIVSAQGERDAGAAYLFTGSSLAAGTTLSADDADYTFVGSDSNDDAAHAVAGAGDIDGDGLDDIIFGAAGHDSSNRNDGAAYIVLGASLVSGATTDLSNADDILIGEGTGHAAGSAIAGAGDIDGDGLDDILVGAEGFERPSDSREVGGVYVLYGSQLGGNGTVSLSTANHFVEGKSSSNPVGTELAGDFDADGDGQPDFLIAAPSSSGWAYGYLVTAATLGSTTSFAVDDADIRFTYSSGGSASHLAIAAAGDVDGDSLDDLLLGVPYDDDAADDAGQAYLWRGQELLNLPTSNASLHLTQVSLLGESAYDLAGYSVAGAGDLDGDGYDDILIGAPYNDDGGTDAGKVYILYGAP